MADEAQATQQAAETQPDPQPQPAQQPEADAQAAPAEQQPPGVKLTLTDGREVYYDGSGVPMDAEGKPLSGDPRPEEKPVEGEQPVAPEAQADGTPADDPVAKAKADVEEANRRLALAEFLAKQPAQTYVPAEPKMPDVKFEPAKLLGRPKESDYQTTDEWRKADEAWTLQQIEIHSKARATQLMQAHHEAQQKQAQADYAAQQEQAEQQRHRITHQEAQRRSGLDPAEFDQKRMELAQASMPPWYTGQGANFLPINIAANALDESVHLNHHLGVSNDGYDNSADLLAAAVKDVDWVRKFSASFPAKAETEQVIRALAEGPNFIHRARQLTDTAEGKKALDWMLSIPAEGLTKQHPLWQRYSEHIRQAASRFDKTTAVPAATPASPATNAPAATPAPAPTNTQPAQQPAPAVTPEMGAGTPAAAEAEPPSLFEDSAAWEKNVIQKLRAKAQRDSGYVPKYLQ